MANRTPAARKRWHVTLIVTLFTLAVAGAANLLGRGVGVGDGIGVGVGVGDVGDRDVVGAPIAAAPGDDRNIRLLGGVETVSGAVIGAIVYKALSIWLVSQTDLSKLVLGGVIVIVTAIFIFVASRRRSHT